jgi:hypothetical protein
LVLQANPESRRFCLTKAGRGSICAAMIKDVTIFIALRRRTLAVWADVCV